MPIEVEPEVLFCQAHLEPFRAEWPRGYPLATVLLVMAFTSLDRVIDYCRADGEVLADTDRINEAFRVLGPACCAVDETLTRRIITTSLADSAEEWHALHAEIKGAMGR